MNAIFQFDPEFSARFVLTLAHFLWQGAVIGLAVLLLGLVLRRASSRVRYAILVMALFTMALCPLVTYSVIEPGTFVSELASASAAQSFDFGEPDTANQALQPDETYGTYETYGTDPADRTDPSDSWPLPNAERPTQKATTIAAPQTLPDWRVYTPYLTLAYIVGVLLMLARLTLGLAGGGRLRKRAERITDSAILEAVRRHAEQLRLHAVPVVAYCQRVAVPTVVGIVRPMILLPTSLATGMPPQQVELLLLHELAHIRRYDHVLNILQRLIEAALFFHPAVWYVSHRIRVEREHCCDDLVIALGGERRAYAESLVAAAALASGDIAVPRRARGHGEAVATAPPHPPAPGRTFAARPSCARRLGVDCAGRDSPYRGGHAIRVADASFRDRNYGSCVVADRRADLYCGRTGTRVERSSGGYGGLARSSGHDF